jgi:lipid-A-disaccharide synthase
VANHDIYFVAGEASGDNHGAALMQSLRQLAPDLSFVGRGGPRMAAVAGSNFRNWTDEAGVVGLWEVVKRYGYFRRQFHETLAEILKARPVAVVLIDYPGFNLRLARALRARSAPQRIIYYISPQVWAWNRRRISKMAKWLDLMLCIFPFEAGLYRKSGLRTVFVGHPMVENLEAHLIETPRDQDLIGLFPGSRAREIRKIFPIMIEAAREIAQIRPGTQFEVAAASERLALEIGAILSKSALGPMFRIRVGETAAMMQRASAGVVASGTATLEAAWLRLPFVLVYKVSWSTYIVARLLMRVKYLGMPNVLADKEIVSEFIQHRAKPREMAKAVLKLLTDSESRRHLISEFDAIVAKLGAGGANRKAARAILDEIGEGSRHDNDGFQANSVT